jgi:multimeric flavodoxin WrbA
MYTKSNTEVTAMKVLALNGAGQKHRNTAEMVKAAFEGAMSASGASGELIHLRDLNYDGCIGCHACKLLNSPSFGKCAMRDDLTAVLEKVLEADVVIIGSPMYFSDITGRVRNLIERWFFPGMTYNNPQDKLYTKRPKVGWVFTCNAPGEFYKTFAEQLVGNTGWLIGDAEYVIASQTQQFEDYSKYAATMFDVNAVKTRHIEQFPKDLDSAREMGKRLAGGAVNA